MVVDIIFGLTSSYSSSWSTPWHPLQYLPLPLISLLSFYMPSQPYRPHFPLQPISYSHSNNYHSNIPTSESSPVHSDNLKFALTFLQSIVSINSLIVHPGIYIIIVHNGIVFLAQHSIQSWLDRFDLSWLIPAEFQFGIHATLWHSVTFFAKLALMVHTMSS